MYTEAIEIHVNLQLRPNDSKFYIEQDPPIFLEHTCRYLSSNPNM